MAHDFTAPITLPSDLIDRCLAWATRLADEHGLPIEASDWWLAAKEIERLRSSIRQIGDLVSAMSDSPDRRAILALARKALSERE